MFSKIDEYKEEISGIGISCTGKIDDKNGVIIGGVNIMRNWVNSSIKKIFTDKYNMPVYINNDVKCVALSEMWNGIGKEENNYVCLTIGTGIGGAIVDNGNLVCGENNFAGEIGHTILKFNGINCKCGKKGCYEAYGSMTALVKEVERITDEAINGEKIFHKVKNNEKVYVDIVNEWILNIGMGIANLVLLLNPRVIVIGGAVSVQKELFLDKLEVVVKSFLTDEHSKYLMIVSAKNFNDAGMLGAVYGLKSSIGK